MAEDALRLLHHLDIAKAHVIGYSMGARIAAFLALAYPDRVRSAVFAGLGANMIHGVGDPRPIEAALLATTHPRLPIPMRVPSGCSPIKPRATAVRLPPASWQRATVSPPASLPH